MKKKNFILVAAISLLVLSSCAGAGENNLWWPDVDETAYTYKKDQDFTDTAVHVGGICMGLFYRGSSYPLDAGEENTNNILYRRKIVSGRQTTQFKDSFIVATKIKIKNKIVDISWDFPNGMYDEIKIPYLETYDNYNRVVPRFPAGFDQTVINTFTFTGTAKYKSATSSVKYVIKLASMEITV